MNADDLKALQAPLKARYRESPGAAVVTLSAEGELDFRGTLGVEKAAPVGFRAIRLEFELDTDESEERRATLLRLAERYCVVLQTLRAAPPIEASLAPAGRRS
jgi:hypothetical protein